MEQIPETQLKLRDAGNQMKLALSNWGDEDVFRSCVNSYISHARSVTFVMQRESSGNPELVEWYEKQMENLKQLPIMKFFNEQRVHIIHRGIVRSISHSFTIDELTLDGESIGRVTATTYVFSDAHKYIPNSNGNVGNLCEQYFAILKTLVHQWKAQKYLLEKRG